MVDPIHRAGPTKVLPPVILTMECSREVNADVPARRISDELHQEDFPN